MNNGIPHNESELPIEPSVNTKWNKTSSEINTFLYKGIFKKGIFLSLKGKNLQ